MIFALDYIIFGVIFLAASFGYDLGFMKILLCAAAAYAFTHSFTKIEPTGV